MNVSYERCAKALIADRNGTKRIKRLVERVRASHHGGDFTDLFESLRYLVGAIRGFAYWSDAPTLGSSL
jgi:hypothetical protein